MVRSRRTLLAAAIGLTTLATTGCEYLLGPQRSRARVSETETITRYEGSTSNMTRREIEYRDSGLIDEITTTAEGDFISRTELTYDSDDLLEDITVIYDESTVIYELDWERGLLTQIDMRSDDLEGIARVEVSYFNGDARYIEKTIAITEDDTRFSETRTAYGYDEVSRVSNMVTNYYSEYDSGFGDPTTSESKSETELRFDSDKGWIDRVTVVTEVPVTTWTDLEDDYCSQYGYYNDGNCDTFCDYPDPDCGGEGPPTPGSTTEWERDTSLWSMSYDDNDRLEEVLAPGGQLTSVEYDDEGRIEETETIDDGTTQRVEYQYEDGQISGDMTFTPSVPFGQFYDVKGESFGTVHVLQMLGLM